MTARDIEIVAHSATVEALLAPFWEQLGGDYEGYRGHIYRVLTYTLHFLDGDQSHRREIETALVFHDIGLWTDKALAYLEPSIERALAANAAQGWGIEPSLLRAIIFWHHKAWPYKGPHARVVNAVRRADWIDGTGGMVRMGLPRATIRKVRAAIPDPGFGDTLMRLASDLGGNRLRGLTRVLLKVYKW